MKRLAFFLLLAACTRRQSTAADTVATGTPDAAAIVPAPTVAASASARPPRTLATDGGLATLLSGSAGATQLPVRAADPGSDFDNGLRESLTTEDRMPVAAVKPRIVLGTPTVTSPIPGFDEVLESLERQLRYCYDDGLRVDPKMEGKLVVEITVKPDNDRVAKVSKNEGISAPVAKCIEGSVDSAFYEHSPKEISRVSLPVTLSIMRY